MNITLFPFIIRAMTNMDWSTLEQSYLNSVELANRFGGQVYYSVTHEYPIVLISGTFYFYVALTGQIMYVDEKSLTMSCPISYDMRELWNKRVADSRRERYLALG